MYTLIDNKTRIVLHTELTRVRMDLLKTDEMAFHYEPDFNTTPVANITKYDKKEHEFVYLTWDEIKTYRTKELTKSDWRMVADYPGSNQDAWKTYRQSLRDIPQDYSKVEDIVFPNKPNALITVIATPIIQEVITPTWSDIDWYDGDTCLYNGVSYTCKRTLLKTWTVVTGDTQNSIQQYWAITNSQLKSWNQAIFDQYKTGVNYNLPPVGSVLNTVDPINVKRYPDYFNSGFWELT